jgi:hypothetical protein
MALLSLKFAACANAEVKAVSAGAEGLGLRQQAAALQGAAR